MEIFLHVGHPKTGTSFLQSAFVRSKNVFEKHGITYPESPVDSIAEEGGVTSGNMVKNQSLKNAISLAQSDKVFISSEFLFGKAAEINELEQHFPDSKVNILLFIRDPLDDAMSAYSQNVKRDGFTKSFEVYLDKFMRLENVKKFLDEVSDGNCDVKITNYSRNKKTILESVGNWLGLPKKSLVAPKNKVVNRSLSPAELKVQRELNRHLGKSGCYFADLVCEELSCSQDDKSLVYAASGTIQKFLKHQTKQAKELLPYLNKNNHYVIPAYKDVKHLFSQKNEDQAVEVTMEHIEILARSMNNVRSELFIERALVKTLQADRMLVRGKEQRAKKLIGQAGFFLKKARRKPPHHISESLKDAHKFYSAVKARIPPRKTG